MTSGIYAIVHKETGRAYIGSAVRFSHRWGVHKHELRNNKHGSAYLQNTWNKYGEDAFEFCILEHVEDKARLIEREQVYLSVLGHFNICPVAGSRFGSSASLATREKISKALMGRKLSKESIEKRSAKRRGQKRSTESTARSAAARRGKPLSQEHKDKLSAALKGKSPWNKGKPAYNRGVPMSAEQRAKMSIGSLGRRHTDASKEKMANASRGRSHTAEARAKISLARKGMVFSEIHREHLRKAWVRRKANLNG